MAAETTTVPLFNCMEDYYGLEHSWSEAKRSWCCANEQLGCNQPHNCSPEDPGNSVDTWNTEKAEFCCRSFTIGCKQLARLAETPEPRVFYDCAAGLYDCRLSWSVAKATWCCRHEGECCMQVQDCDSTHEGNSYALWSVPKKEWCCMHMDVLCQQVYQPAVYGGLQPQGLSGGSSAARPTAPMAQRMPLPMLATLACLAALVGCVVAFRTSCAGELVGARDVRSTRVPRSHSPMLPDELPEDDCEDSLLSYR